MSNNQITLNQWVENFEAGKYASADVHTQCDAGWYDWFCKDNQLITRMYRMAPRVVWFAKQLADFNRGKTYVFFKNNCPCFGPTYDDFRICDINSGDVLFTISNKEVYSKMNDFNEPICSGWKEFKKWVKENREELNRFITDNTLDISCVEKKVEVEAIEKVEEKFLDMGAGI